MTAFYKSGGYPLERPISSGIQTYDTKKQEWPVTEPLTKLEGKYQVFAVPVPSLVLLNLILFLEVQSSVLSKCPYYVL